MAVAREGRRPYAARLPAGQRREQLLDAALEIAVDRGFHAVTVEGVARAVGVTRPVVYGLFADRDALLHALADRSDARAQAQLAGVLPALPGPGDDADPDALLLAGLEAYLRAVAAQPRDWTVILLPPEGAPEQLRQRVRGQRRVVLASLRELCAWGLEQRGGPAGLDPDLFARGVLTLAEGAARLVLLDPGRWQPEQFTGFARDLLAALSR